MKIVVAADSFKGSCSTVGVANALEIGIKRVCSDTQVIKLPMADGGEGTVDTLIAGAGGTLKEVDVLDPLGRTIKAHFGILRNGTAVIEMAAASGLMLLEHNELNPMVTTTYGTGQLIKAAMDSGCTMILIGIGGSATNDGGIGMAQALGVSFKDDFGNEVGFGGKELLKIRRISLDELDARIKNTRIVIMSDVTNPLCGEKGAARVYGPQKGATDLMIRELDNGLEHFAALIKRLSNKDVTITPGSGAAGGLGAGLIAFCNAEINCGIDEILNVLEIEKHLVDADLVITGEGRIDHQSAFGKVPVGVGMRAKKYNVPVIAVVGSVGEGAEAVYNYGITAIVGIINRPMTLEEAMNNSVSLIENSGEFIMRMLQAKIKTLGQTKG